MKRTFYSYRFFFLALATVWGVMSGSAAQALLLDFEEFVGGQRVNSSQEVSISAQPTFPRIYDTAWGLPVHDQHGNPVDLGKVLVIANRPIIDPPEPPEPPRPPIDPPKPPRPPDPPVDPPKPPRPPIDPPDLPRPPVILGAEGNGTSPGANVNAGRLFPPELPIDPPRPPKPPRPEPPEPPRPPRPPIEPPEPPEPPRPPRPPIEPPEPPEPPRPPRPRIPIDIYARNGVLSFDFSNLEGGGVLLKSMDFLDVEKRGGKVTLYGFGHTLLDTFDIPRGGNYIMTSLNFTGLTDVVTAMDVELKDAAGVDNILAEAAPEPHEWALLIISLTALVAFACRRKPVPAHST